MSPPPDVALLSLCLECLQSTSRFRNIPLLSQGSAETVSPLSWRCPPLSACTMSLAPPHQPPRSPSLLLCPSNSIQHSLLCGWAITAQIRPHEQGPCPPRASGCLSDTQFTGNAHKKEVPLPALGHRGVAPGPGLGPKEGLPLQAGSEEIWGQRAGSW